MINRFEARLRQEELFAAAERAYNTDNLDQAAVLYRQAYEAFPESETAIKIKQRLAEVEPSREASQGPNADRERQELLYTAAKQAQEAGDSKRANDILKRMVELNPGTELAMRSLFDIEDTGQLLGTVRQMDVKRQMGAQAPLYFPRLEKSKPEPAPESKLDVAQKDMLKGNYLEALTTYQTVANDSKASPATREAAGRLVKEATKRLNEVPSGD